LDADNKAARAGAPRGIELTVEDAVARARRRRCAFSALPAPWPADEIWSFQAQDRLRVVTV
jgi:hypothetical protein